MVSGKIGSITMLTNADSSRLRSVAVDVILSSPLQGVGSTKLEPAESAAEVSIVIDEVDCVSESRRSTLVGPRRLGVARFTVMARSLICENERDIGDVPLDD